jgi:predicted Zn-ribbon and HTH transcriptional regulator
MDPYSYDKLKAKDDRYWAKFMAGQSSNKNTRLNNELFVKQNKVNTLAEISAKQSFDVTTFSEIFKAEVDNSKSWLKTNCVIEPELTSFYLMKAYPEKHDEVMNFLSKSSLSFLQKSKILGNWKGKRAARDLDLIYVTAGFKGRNCVDRNIRPSRICNSIVKSLATEPDFLNYANNAYTMNFKEKMSSYKNKELGARLIREQRFKLISGGLGKPTKVHDMGSFISNLSDQKYERNEPFMETLFRSYKDKLLSSSKVPIIKLPERNFTDTGVKMPTSDKKMLLTQARKIKKSLVVNLSASLMNPGEHGKTGPCALTLKKRLKKRFCKCPDYKSELIKVGNYYNELTRYIEENRHLDEEENYGISSEIFKNYAIFSSDVRVGKTELVDDIRKINDIPLYGDKREKLRKSIGKRHKRVRKAKVSFNRDDPYERKSWRKEQQKTVCARRITRERLSWLTSKKTNKAKISMLVKLLMEPESENRFVRTFYKMNPELKEAVKEHGEKHSLLKSLHNVSLIKIWSYWDVDVFKHNPTLRLRSVKAAVRHVKSIEKYLDSQLVKKKEDAELARLEKLVADREKMRVYHAEKEARLQAERSSRGKMERETNKQREERLKKEMTPEEWAEREEKRRLGKLAAKEAGKGITPPQEETKSQRKARLKQEKYDSLTDYEKLCKRMGW